LTTKALPHRPVRFLREIHPSCESWANLHHLVDNSPWHRREYGDLYRGLRDAAGAIALSPAGPVGELDPQFAMAWADLAIDYSGIGDSVLSAESSTKAWQLRDRVSDREKFYIDFLYERQVRGNLEEAYQTLERTGVAKDAG